MKERGYKTIYTMEEMVIMGMTPDYKYNMWNMLIGEGWWEVDGIKYRNISEYRLIKINEILK